MPRKDAAERYSPLIAEAFSPGRTEREATKKSEVVRLNRSPQVPMASVARVTSRTATKPMRVVHDERSTTRANARSLRSARRT